MGMILGMEPKNMVILTTCCRVTAIYIFQYIVIYFSKSRVTLVYIIVYQKQKCFMEDLQWTTCGFGSHLRNRKKISEKIIFQRLDLSLSHSGQKSLKALCLSSKMVKQRLFFLLWLTWQKKIKGPTHFFNGNLTHFPTWLESRAPSRQIFTLSRIWVISCFSE